MISERLGDLEETMWISDGECRSSSDKGGEHLLSFALVKIFCHEYYFLMFVLVLSILWLNCWSFVKPCCKELNVKHWTCSTLWGYQILSMRRGIVLID